MSRNTPFIHLAGWALLSVMNLSCHGSVANPPNESDSWINLGLQGRQVIKLRLSAGSVYACTGHDGLYRHSKWTIDQNWEYIGLNDSSLINGIDTTKGVNSPNTEGVVDVAVNPKNENEILAAILVLKPHIPGIYKTINGGRTWYEADSGFGRDQMWWEGSDTGKVKGANTLFCPAGDFRTVFACTPVDGFVSRSIDGGEFWGSAVLGVGGRASITSMAGDPANSRTIYAGSIASPSSSTTIVPTKLFKTTDGGDSWTTLLPNPVFYDNLIASISITAAPDAIYLGMKGFALTSIDQGSTWTQLTASEDPNNVLLLAADPVNPNHLITADGNILVESYDCGNSWSRILPSLEGTIAWLVWDKDSGNLYCSVANLGGVRALRKSLKASADISVTTCLR